MAFLARDRDFPFSARGAQLLLAVRAAEVFQRLSVSDFHLDTAEKARELPFYAEIEAELLLAGEEIL